MKIYERPIATVILLETNDIITNSNNDNIGGILDGWGWEAQENE